MRFPHSIHRAVEVPNIRVSEQLQYPVGMRRSHSRPAVRNDLLFLGGASSSEHPFQLGGGFQCCHAVFLRHVPRPVDKFCARYSACSFHFSAGFKTRPLFRGARIDQGYFRLVQFRENVSRVCQNGPIGLGFIVTRND